MAAFAISAPRYAGNSNLLGISRNNLEICPAQEQIELPASGFATQGFQHATVSKAFTAERKRFSVWVICCKNCCRSGSARKIGSKAEVSITISEVFPSCRIPEFRPRAGCPMTA
jgi:hypothetical protein